MPAGMCTCLNAGVVVRLCRSMAMLRRIVLGFRVLRRFGRVGMALVTGIGRRDRFAVHVYIRKEIELEVVTRHFLSSHELMREPAGVSDDERHWATGGDPHRVGRERVLVQRDLDLQGLSLLTARYE
jgi:hypothetical protein